MISRITFSSIAFWLVIVMPATVFAQFGVLNKKNALNNDQPNVAADLNDMMNDPEMLAAMEIFANMSPEEMEETMKELAGILGDDPETLLAMKQVQEEISKMSETEIKGSLENLIKDDELTVAMADTMRMLSESDEATFETQILPKRNEILQAVIESGQISHDDAAHYQQNPAAWEKELRHIWKELSAQADAFR